MLVGDRGVGGRDFRLMTVFMVFTLLMGVAMLNSTPARTLTSVRFRQATDTVYLDEPVDNAAGSGSVPTPTPTPSPSMIPSPSFSKFGTVAAPQRLGERPVIALGISTTTRSTGITTVGGLPLFSVMLPSFWKTIGKSNTMRYHYWIYLGFDQGDTFYDNMANLKELRRQFQAQRTQWGFTDMDVRIFLYRFEYPPGKSVSAIVASDLMRIAYDDGADYLYRVNDDTMFTTSDWGWKLTSALGKLIPHGVGTVGPFCKEGNDKILTHHMTTRKHLEIFPHYYPRAFEGWFSDDWISEVYTPTRTRKLIDVKVQHHNPVGTRYTPDYNARGLLPGELRLGAAAINAYLKDGKVITRAPSIGRHKFVDTNTGEFVVRSHEGGAVIDTSVKVGALMWYLVQDHGVAGGDPATDPFFSNFFASLCETEGPAIAKDPASAPASVKGTKVHITVHVAYALPDARPAERAKDVGTAALRSDEYRAKFELYFRDRVEKCGWSSDEVSLRLVPIGKPEGHFVKTHQLAPRVYNTLAAKAMGRGDEYLVRVEAGDKYLNPGWVQQMIEALRGLSPANLGLAAMRCKSSDDGNDDKWGSDPHDAVTHTMMHRSTVKALGDKYAVAWHMDSFNKMVFQAAKRLVYPEGTAAVCPAPKDLSAPTKEFIGDYLPARITKGLEALHKAVKEAPGGAEAALPDGSVDPKNIGKVIGFGISSTSRGIKGATMDNIPFFKVFLDSFIKTNLVTGPGGTKTCASSKYEYRIYLGIDNGDTVYDAPDGPAKLYAKFHEVLRSAGLQENDRGCIKLRALKFFYPRGSSVSALVASDVMRVAYNEGADYLYRVNDDTEILTAGWEDRLTHALARMVPPNTGVSGPLCEQGNLDILTHHMTHRSHLDLFDYYYPRALVDWFSDDYISFVYGPARSTLVREAPVAHRNPHGTRYTATMSAKTKLKPSIDEGRVAIAKWLDAGRPARSGKMEVKFEDLDPASKAT